MAFNTYSCLSWTVDKFYSISSLRSSSFGVPDISAALILKQNCFKISSRDCFTIKIESNSMYPKFPDFLVSTFIKDKLGRVRFLQNILVKCSEFNGISGPIIWNVLRNDLLSISDSLQGDVVDIGVIFGPESKSVTEFKQESLQTIKRVNTEHKMIQTAFDETNSACLESLLLDFSNLLNNEIDADVKIICGDFTFAAHRIVLSARSEVFAAMFRNDMSEKRSGCIEITDREPAVIKMFLQYIYSGKIPNLTDDTAPLLYSTADKYAVAALQRRCAEFMMQTISENNACRFLLLAHSHDDSNFKRYVMEFIIMNEKILLEDEWLKLCDKNPKLSNEVYREHMKYTISQKKV